MDYLVKGPKKFVADRLSGKYHKNMEKDNGHFPEFQKLDNEIQWFGASKMIYLSVLDVIHESYKGLMDYGYIRLVEQYFRRRNIVEVNETIMMEAEKDILPAENYQQLLEKLKKLMSVEVFA